MRFATTDLSDTPMTVAGVGGGMPTRWTYSEYGRFLSVYGIQNKMSLVFNLASADDIKQKLDLLYKRRDEGLVSNTDIQELEERLRIMSDVNFYGNGSQEASLSALSEEAKPTTSQRQIDHLRKIQPLTHTDEANEKRRKTIKAKRDMTDLGLD